MTATTSLARIRHHDGGFNCDSDAGPMWFPDAGKLRRWLDYTGRADVLYSHPEDGQDRLIPAEWVGVRPLPGLTWTLPPLNQPDPMQDYH